MRWTMIVMLALATGAAAQAPEAPTNVQTTAAKFQVETMGDYVTIDWNMADCPTLTMSERTTATTRRLTLTCEP